MYTIYTRVYPSCVETSSYSDDHNFMFRSLPYLEVHHFISWQAEFLYQNDLRAGGQNTSLGGDQIVDRFFWQDYLALAVPGSSIRK